jgi:fatty acid desaturase 2 (delta-6 desaturase)
LALTRDFQSLHGELEAEGFFEPSPAHLLYRLGELLFLLLAAYWCLHNAGWNSWGMTLTCIGCLSMFAGRCGWLMHEGGHHSLTGLPKVDRFLQSFLYGFGPGMSAVWWSSQHNRHHAMPQRLEHDVDLETLPLLAFNKRVVKSNRVDEGKGFFIQNQAVLFLLLDCFLVAWFWKLYLHPRYAIKKRAWTDLAFMGLHYYVVASQLGSVWMYMGAVWLSGIYIFGNFSLSHTHLPVTSGKY